MASDKAKGYFFNLAKKHNLNYVSLQDLEIKVRGLKFKHFADYFKLQAIPITETDQLLTVATSEPSEKNINLIREYWHKTKHKKIHIVGTSRQDIVNTLAQKFEKELVHFMAHTRDDLDYKHSASYTFSLAEKIVIIGIILTTIILCITQGNRIITPLWFGLVLSMGTSLILSYKVALSIQSMLIRKSLKKKITLDLNTLPIYTVLIPVLREKEETLSILFESLKELDYPKELLDIKLLIEQDDSETLTNVNKFDLDWNYQIVIVPPGLPRSKPRACNYGMQLAFGEYLTIYDAEDRPDPLQLKTVIQHFQDSVMMSFKLFGDYNSKLACVQAALNYYNYNENLLTRLFTIEYSHWFDCLVPALSNISAPVPLGGTSNHFRMDILRKLGGWDPYIGTEDAEIGVRLYRNDYRVEATLVTTYEEANTQLGNWFKQRTRWNKGYLQTYLVNMRDPINMIKQIGVWRFINFQLFVGGNVFVQLANLPLLLLLIEGLIFRNEFFHYPYPKLLFVITWYNFLISNVSLLVCEFMATYNRRLYSLLIYVPLKYFYWMLMSLSGYYSVIELLVRPGYWYKTEHGLSKQGRKTDIPWEKK